MEKPLNDDAKAVLFRSVREVLSNTVRHARARHITVRIKRDRQQVLMVVTDDGIGFDVQADLTKGNGFGLLNIQESLERLGGCFDIKTSAGSGCKVTLGAPLEDTIQARQ